MAGQMVQRGKVQLMCERPVIYLMNEGFRWRWDMAADCRPTFREHKSLPLIFVTGGFMLRGESLGLFGLWKLEINQRMLWYNCIPQY